MHGRVGVGAAGVAAPGAAEGAGAGGVGSVAVSAPPRPSGCQSSRPPEGAAEGPFPAKTREDDTHEGPLDPQAELDRAEQWHGPAHPEVRARDEALQASAAAAATATEHAEAAHAALGVLRSALALQPSDSELHWRMGHVHESALRDVRGAETHYRAALAEDPAHTHAALSLAGLVLARASDAAEFDEAEALYCAAVQQAPGCHAALVSCGAFLHHVRGDVAQARVLIDKGLALSPSYAPGRWGIGERGGTGVWRGGGRARARQSERARGSGEGSATHHANVYAHAHALAQRTDPSPHTRT